jgi:hypothetical protein
MGFGDALLRLDLVSRIWVVREQSDSGEMGKEKK